MEQQTILVVDDNEGIRELLRDVFEDAGYAVRTAADGLEGLERIDAGGIDLAIIDLMMPVMNGYEVANTLRDRESGHTPPFILVSAYNMSGWSAEGLGAVAGYGKPLDLVALTSSVDRQLQLAAA